MSRPKDENEFIKRMKVIYTSFDIKDLSESEFIRQMIELMDPKKIMSDLGDIELKRAREKLNRMRIDKAIARN